MKLPVLSQPQVPPAPRRAWQWLLRGWDRLAIYLPLVLMVMLALATYWMVRNTPQGVEPAEARPKLHEVDFFMRGAVMRTFDETGRLTTQLVGTEMRHYEDTATVEVDQPRWLGISPEGRLSHGSARRGVSKDDSSELQLFGEALVRRDAFRQPDSTVLPRLQYEGEFLHVFADDERVQSHLPVRLLSGDHEFSGERFRYDNLGRVAELEGRVKARLMPRQAATPR